MNKNFKNCSLILFLILSYIKLPAQTPHEVKLAKQHFEGEWFNKKEKRHLSISYDNGYMTVNDWLDHSKTSVDAYRAFIKHGILVMPEYKSDPIQPYSDMIIRHGILWYRCKCSPADKNNYNDSTAFTKIKS
jgi:hypothetical protein